jgi:N,N'-diacetyllegionaminate synthase
VTEIVAEAGVNHGGRPGVAFLLADAARNCGADAVKFQTFTAERLLRAGDPDWRTIKQLELPRHVFVQLSRHCQDIGIEFMSTPGDTDSLHFLVEECGVRRIKIGSDDLTNDALVDAAYETGLPVVLSTGMADLKEVGDVLFREASRFDRTILLHCVSLYPCPYELANLSAITSMFCEFAVPVGYSDHCRDDLACLAAIALGAMMIEKHLMISSDSNDAVDEAVSITPLRFCDMVEQIRLLEKMMGSGAKEPSTAEAAQRGRLRKGPDGLRGLVEASVA